MLRTAILSSTGEARDHRYELRWFNRFGDVHLKTIQDGASAIFGSCECGERDCRNFASMLTRQLTYLSYGFVAIFVRHTDVHDQDVWFSFAQNVTQA